MNITERESVVVRFSGDSGDGMQLAGNIFSTVSATVGNSISTFPDYPADIRAPQGSLTGVSGFQVHIGASQVYTPGDQCDVLVAMNAAALKTQYRYAKPDATIIIDTDSFGPKDLEKAQFQSEDYLGEMGIDPDRVIACPLTSMVKNCLAESGMDVKSITVGGGSDGNFTSAWGIPTPGAHTEDKRLGREQREKEGSVSNSHFTISSFSSKEKVQVE